MENSPSKFASWSLVASALILAAGIVGGAGILQRGGKAVAAAPQEVKNRLMTAEEIEQTRRVPDYWATSMTPAERWNAIGLASDELIITDADYEAACFRALNIGWLECRLGKTLEATIAEYRRRCPPIAQQVKARPSATDSAAPVRP